MRDDWTMKKMQIDIYFQLPACQFHWFDNMKESVFGLKKKWEIERYDHGVRNLRE